MATQRKGEKKLHNARKNQLKRCTVKKDILIIERINFCFTNEINVSEFPSILIAVLSFNFANW